MDSRAENCGFSSEAYHGIQTEDTDLDWGLGKTERVVTCLAPMISWRVTGLVSHVPGL